MSNTTKTELTKNVYMWSDGTHTVTTLEAQAVKLAAKLHMQMLAKEQDPDLQVVVGFLLGLSNEDEETIAKHIMEAKRREADAGRVPMSADMIRH